MDAHSSAEHSEASRLKREPEFRQLLRIARRMNADRFERLQLTLSDMARDDMARDGSNDHGDLCTDHSSPQNSSCIADSGNHVDVQL